MLAMQKAMNENQPSVAYLPKCRDSLMLIQILQAAQEFCDNKAMYLICTGAEILPTGVALVTYGILR